MAVVLVTGGAGMLGTDLCNYLTMCGHIVYAPTINEMNICKKDEIEKVIDAVNPKWVINCAAHTKVDIANHEERELHKKINYEAVTKLVNVCNKFSTTLVQISTDYVFSLPQNQIANEETEVSPANDYGYWKAEAEKYIRECSQRYKIVRTSWLYGHHGKNFVETMINLLDSKTCFKVVNDQHGCPTWTVYLCNKLLEILSYYPSDETYHVCGDGVTTWYEFAKKIEMYLGYGKKIVPCDSEDYKTLSPRPKNSAMISTKFENEHWTTQLISYLESRRNGIERYHFSWR